MSGRYYDALDKIELIEAVNPDFENIGKVEFYSKAAQMLSETAGRKAAWSWRYIQGFLNGTILPGEKFVSAIHELISEYRKSKSISIPKPKLPRVRPPKIGRDENWIEYYMRQVKR